MELIKLHICHLIMEYIAWREYAKSMTIVHAYHPKRATFLNVNRLIRCAPLNNAKTKTINLNKVTKTLKKKATKNHLFCTIRIGK